jgi:hypothetical protein
MNHAKIHRSRKRGYNTRAASGAGRGKGIKLRRKVEGLTQEDMFNVTCDTQEGVDEAQTRIDSGRQMVIGGIPGTLVSVGFMMGWARKTKEVDELKRKGKLEGYKLSLNADPGGRVQMLVKKTFLGIALGNLAPPAPGTSQGAGGGE